MIKFYKIDNNFYIPKSKLIQNFNNNYNIKKIIYSLLDNN